MAFTTGTSTDYHDLLADLRTWATGTLGWTELEYTAPPGGLTTEAYLALQGPGAGADKRVYAFIRSVYTASAGAYNWQISAGVGQDDDAEWGLQAGEPAYQPYAVLSQNTITYWFYGNDRHIKVVTKVGSVYTWFYLGFFLPWGLPDEYPFPLLVGGNAPSADYTASSTATDFRNPADPGGIATGGLAGGTSMVRSPAGLWRKMSNHDTGSLVNEPLNDTALCDNALLCTWPFHTIEAGVSTTTAANWTGVYTGFSSGGGFDNMRPTAQNERPLWAIEILDSLGPSYGALDGAYALPGFGLTSEQTLTVDSRTFRVFQNCFRSSGNDFVAIEEI